MVAPSAIRPREKQWMARKTLAMAATPAASPSMLSSMFTAFVMPTSQNIVISALTAGDDVQGRSSPVWMTIAAATICTASFWMGLRVAISSISPITNSSAAAGRMARRNAGGTSTASSSTARTATNIPTPPRSAVGLLCQRSLLGAETIPTRRASQVTSGVRAAVARSARSAGSQTSGRVNAVIRVSSFARGRLHWQPQRFHPAVKRDHAADAVLEGMGDLEAGQGRDLGSIRHAPRHVLESLPFVGFRIRHVDDLGARLRQPADRLGQLLDGDLLGRPDVEHFADRAGMVEELRQRADGVADVAEAARLRAVAEDRHRPPGQ